MKTLLILLFMLIRCCILIGLEKLEGRDSHQLDRSDNEDQFNK